MQFTRPVRGAVRLDAFKWDAQALRGELERIQAADWRSLKYGERWSDVALYVKGKDGKVTRHPLLDVSPALESVLHGFPAPVLDMCVALLAPGGSVKEHRDISGGTAAGVIRFHIPVVTHEDVSFYVSGVRVRMGEGELWNLDTTYRHRVVNGSNVERLHLIIDLEANRAIRALLPEPDWRDRVHSVYFAMVCVWKGLALLVTDPRQFGKRVRSFIRLRILRESVLYTGDR